MNKLKLCFYVCVVAVDALGDESHKFKQLISCSRLKNCIITVVIATLTGNEILRSYC